MSKSPCTTAETEATESESVGAARGQTHVAVVAPEAAGGSPVRWDDDGHWSDESGADMSEDGGSDRDVASSDDGGWDLVERQDE